MGKKNISESLQRFTDFEKVKTVEEFIEIEKTGENKKKELLNWLLGKVNDAVKKEKPEEREIDKYFNRLELFMPFLDKDIAEEEKQYRIDHLKRERWYLNDELIKKCINDNILKYGILPTNSNIQTETGLSRVTINKHLKESGDSLYKTEELEKFKILNNLALGRIYKIGVNNNDAKALKLFIDLTGESKKTVINNNYIQINNTRIDSLLIDQLPVETKNQIEALILNTKKI
jgi:hypothetical protein